ncbi:hypothetical protein J6590_101378, partial [Homalodisca vitripennis]
PQEQKLPHDTCMFHNNWNRGIYKEFTQSKKRELTSPTYVFGNVMAGSRQTNTREN